MQLSFIKKSFSSCVLLATTFFASTLNCAHEDVKHNPLLTITKNLSFTVGTITSCAALYTGYKTYKAGKQCLAAWRSLKEVKRAHSTPTDHTSTNDASHVQQKSQTQKNSFEVINYTVLVWPAAKTTLWALTTAKLASWAYDFYMFYYGAKIVIQP